MDETDKPALSQDTLRALNEFLSEAQAATDEKQNPFSENWGLSQVDKSCPGLFALVTPHLARTYISRRSHPRLMKELYAAICLVKVQEL